MAKLFRPYSLDQVYLLPPSLEQWLPERHLARFIVEVTGELDLSGLLRRYQTASRRGAPAYDPLLMLRLLLYAYCIGKRSSRQIEQAVVNELAFRYLTAGQQPDHDTIATFRRENLSALSELFGQVLGLCRASGMVKLGHVAIDGTKMQANADRNQTMRYRELEKEEQELRQQVEQILAEAEQLDQQEDERYGKGGKPEALPADMATRQARLEKIRAAKRKLEAEAAERATAAQQEREANGGKHANNAAKKRYQKAMQPLEKANPQCNLTDPDSKIMKNPAGGYVQGYNAQAAVDGAEQVIVAAEVSNEAADQTQLVPMVKAVESEVGEAASVILADAGYFSIEALQDEVFEEQKVLVSPESRLARRQGRIRIRHELAERMRAELASGPGEQSYRQRAGIIEPVFAFIKQARGIRRFLLRGLAAVRAEWRFICLTHNLLKLRRFRMSQFAAAAA
ncbi:MAG TPA: IS1182 family transposase [Terriglobales bacterium]|nr:IS1182 family transposase [Terriglobales bacterium]